MGVGAGWRWCHDWLASQDYIDSRTALSVGVGVGGSMVGLGHKEIAKMEVESM